MTDNVYILGIYLILMILLWRKIKKDSGKDELD